MRKVIINDKKLKTILDKRSVVFKEVREVNEKIVKLDNERTKLGYKMDRLKEKTAPIIKKHGIEIGEFEVISSVGIENEKPTAQIVDQIEEYKKVLRENAKD
jgi:hypothetical protein